MFNYKKKYLKYIKKYYNLVNEINQDGGKSKSNITYSELQENFKILISTYEGILSIRNNSKKFMESKINKLQTIIDEKNAVSYFRILKK